MSHFVLRTRNAFADGWLAYVLGLAYDPERSAPWRDGWQAGHETVSGIGVPRPEGRLLPQRARGVRHQLGSLLGVLREEIGRGQIVVAQVGASEDWADAAAEASAAAPPHPAAAARA